MPKQPKRITLAILLTHIQGLRGEFVTRMDGMGQRMDRMESHMDRVEQKIDRMHVNLSGQIDAIDQRLDAVEIEFLPKRVTKLEKAMGMRS